MVQGEPKDQLEKRQALFLRFRSVLGRVLLYRVLFPHFFLFRSLLFYFSAFVDFNRYFSLC